ncbi:MAG: penicillin-binding protein 2 [Candidatus Moranbacteria bacterium]|nr:penicillin-binding protein 2 [Candidatus Moranbacteria bacterium]
MIGKYLLKKRKKRSAEIEEVSRLANDFDEAPSLAKPIPKEGAGFFKILVILIFFLLAARVFYLQVVKGAHYSELSRENRTRYLAVKAPRGLVFDRNGKKLTRNVPSFDLVAIPADLPRNAAERIGEERKMASLLGMNDQSFSALVESQDLDSFNPILIKENISEEEALIFSERKPQMPGFQLDQTAVRFYEDAQYFSSIMGYSGKIAKDELEKYPGYLMTDYVGKIGLEYSYEKYLRGVHGKEKAEVDSSGNIKKNLGVDSPVNGDDLHLNIDADLQKKIQDSLGDMLLNTNTKTAAAVAINPKDGGVLALVNLPSYDNNLFARGISREDYQKLISDGDKPMFNRSISGEYPPGSTFKLLVAAVALEEKTITSSTSLDCPGVINIGSYRFPDWKTHGVTDIRKAIAESCDVFFYAVGGGWNNIPALGIDRIKQYANFFGLGKPLGVDIPGEASGLIPDQSWKQNRFGEKWYLGDDYHCAIGQGFDTATPLQIANYTAAVANGGTVYQPHLVQYIQKPDGSREEIKPKILNSDFISPSNIQVVREGMRQAIISGTAQTLKDLPVAVAGKTGTAQFGSENKTHGWFVSFAPYDNPQIALAVLVEGGGEGHSTAVPVAKDVYQWYFEERNKK